MAFRMLLSAYKTHWSNVIFNPSKPTGTFRVELASWKIKNNASNTEVAAKFGYVGIVQIVQWKKIYSKLGPNGLLSIQKGRNPKLLFCILRKNNFLVISWSDITLIAHKSIVHSIDLCAITLWNNKNSYSWLSRITFLGKVIRDNQL